MSRLFFAAVLASSLIVSAPAAAEQPVPAASGKAPVAKAPPVQEKLVCKSFTTGTIIPKRVCKTASDWDMIESDSSDRMDRDNARRAGCTGSNC